MAAYPDLKYVDMKVFTTILFEHIPFLRSRVDKVYDILQNWRKYKLTLPSYGAILLNKTLDKVLLVQGLKYWSFPKGKMNKKEDSHVCAVREVFEETGFDISNLINTNEYIEAQINGRLIRLYVITGVQTDFEFKPESQKEIQNIKWFELEDLPTHYKDLSRCHITGNANSFYTVCPFVE